MSSTLMGCSSKSAGADARPVQETAAAERPVFDADSAYRYVAEQVVLGSRVPGSIAHARCVDYISGKLATYGAEVSVTDTIVTDVENNRVKVRNISAVFNPGASKRVLLAAHYDTRPHADRDPDPANHATPIDGANDGASGVAVLLEIARNISQLPDNLGVEMLFLDAEDSGSYDGDDATWCVGSQLWSATRRPDAPRIAYGILLDMVGGKDARFHREYYSELKARAVNDRIARAARALGYADRFPNKIGGAINDDHIYLMESGIPVADLIECANSETGSFPPTWHTLQDNLDNIDPTTLSIVGQVVIKAITL